MGTAGAWTALFHGVLRAACAAAWLPFLACSSANAAGTTAGTLIGNTASLQFRIGAGPLATTNASSPDIVVATVVTVVVTSQDAAPVGTGSPATSRALSFTVTNAGNAPEAYRLSRADNLPGDQFDPVPAAAGALWIESGAQPGFQASGPNADIAYLPGVNDPTLAPDASVTVYLVSDIPGGAANGALGKSSLTATSTTPGAAGAAPGTLLGTFSGVQSVAGPQTVATVSGSYLVAAVSVTVAKSVAAVRDPQGGTRVVTGSVLTYRVVLSVTGTGVADALSVSDPLPTSLSYVPGSLTVDGAPRTDAADADGASANGNTVTADFGNLAAPAQRVLEFKATVN
jgi:uncharacterized repeat protein (TIGR01451 family)